MIPLNLTAHQYKEQTFTMLKNKPTAFVIGLIMVVAITTVLSIRFHVLGKLKRLPVAVSSRWNEMMPKPTIGKKAPLVAIVPTVVTTPVTTPIPSPTNINQLYPTASPYPTLTPTLKPSPTITISPTMILSATPQPSTTPTAVIETGETSSTKTERVTFKGKTYTVKEGDSLASIALESYGDPNAWTIIAKANNLPNGNAIEVGMVLKIPR